MQEIHDENSFHMNDEKNTKPMSEKEEIKKKPKEIQLLPRHA